MNIRDEYDGVVGELLDRARLIKSERKCDDEQAVKQAIDDGFYWTEDRAIVLAYALDSGVISWGAEFDWLAVDEMLRADMLAEINN